MRKLQFPLQLLVAILLVFSFLVAPISSVIVSAQEEAGDPTEEVVQDPDDGSADPAEPTDEPTAEPTDEPTAEPTDEPTAEPTDEPTAEPTDEPTAEPTEEPTAEPTEEPVVEPPVIDAFKADPASLTLVDTETLTTTLSWDVTDADSLDLNGEDVTEFTEKMFEIAESTVYTLTAANDAGSVESVVVVTVEAAVTEVDNAGEIGSQAFTSDVTTVVYVQDVSGAANTFGITWHNEDGSVAAVTANENLQAYERRSYIYPGAGSFRGSVVIQGGDVAANVKLTNDPSSDTASVAGYSGASTGSTDPVYLPSLHRSNWASLISIQNTGSGPTGVTVNINDGLLNIDCGTIEQYGTCYVNLDDYPALGTAWYGYGVVTSDAEPIYVVVREDYASTETIVAYEGIPQGEGATRLFFPVYNRNSDSCSNSEGSGWNGNLQIQNTAATPAQARITYKNTDGTTAETITRDLAPYGGVYVSGLCYPSSVNNWYGAVVVESILDDGNGLEPLVGLNLMVWLKDRTRGNYGIFKAVSSGHQSVYAPFFAKNNSGSPDAFTGENVQILVQNLDLAETASIQVTYYNTDGSYQTSFTQDVSPGSNFYQHIGTVSGLPDNSWSGSVMITSDRDIAAIAQGQSVGGKATQRGWPRDTANFYSFIGRD